MYGYIPANQFNVDLCLDTISILNRTTKDGNLHTPYELFTGERIDYERDFRCRWGELVIVKKPKGISSDLNVTGEWAMVVRRFMNKTGVLKVFGFLPPPELLVGLLLPTCLTALPLHLLVV